MRIQTTNTNIYKFEELNKEAQENAITKWYDNDELDIQSEQFTEFSEELLNLLNFKNVKIAYSLSSCQGDGFSFTCDKMYHDEIFNFLNMVKNKESKEKGYQFLESLLEKLNKELYSCVNVDKINNDLFERFEFYTEFNKISHHYSHERTVSIDCDYYTEDFNEIEITNNERDLFKQTETFLKEAYILICKTLEKEGYSQIYYKMDNEEFKDSCDANDYEFLEDGTMY